MQNKVDMIVNVIFDYKILVDLFDSMKEYPPIQKLQRISDKTGISFVLLCNNTTESLIGQIPSSFVNQAICALKEMRDEVTSRQLLDAYFNDRLKFDDALKILMKYIPMEIGRVITLRSFDKVPKESRKAMLDELNGAAKKEEQVNIILINELDSIVKNAFDSTPYISAVKELNNKIENQKQEIKNFRLNLERKNKIIEEMTQKAQERNEQIKNQNQKIKELEKRIDQIYNLSRMY